MAITRATILSADCSTNSSSPHNYVVDGTTPATGWTHTIGTGTFTPVAGRLYLLAITHFGTNVPVIDTMTSDTGLDFVEVANVIYDPPTTGLAKLHIYRAMKAAGLGSGTITIGTVNSASNITVAVEEFDGVDTSGTDGSGAIAQSKTGAGGASNAPTCTFDNALGAADNALFVAAAADDDSPAGTQWSPEAGGVWAELTEASPSTETVSLWTGWRPTHGSDSTPSAVLSTSENWGIIALEIVAAAGGGGPIQPPRTMHQSRMRRAA